MKIPKKKKLFFFFWGGGWGGGSGWGGVRLGDQGRCEQRSEVFVKNSKNNRGSGRGGGFRGVRVEVNEELKFL